MFLNRSRPRFLDREILGEGTETLPPDLESPSFPALRNPPSGISPGWFRVLWNNALDWKSMSFEARFTESGLAVVLTHWFLA
jgi:hypothetical protein